jgi:hypothetical protein
MIVICHFFYIREVKKMARISVEKNEPYVFFENVPAGTTVTLEKLLELNSRAKHLLVAIPPGPEGDLRIRAYFLTPEKTPREFINFIGSRHFFDGDDQDYPIPLDVPMKAYSKLIVEATNLDLVNDYTMNVIISVEYE